MPHDVLLANIAKLIAESQPQERLIMINKYKVAKPNWKKKKRKPRDN